MKAFPVKVVIEEHAAGNTWQLICDDCPLSAKLRKIVPCMGGAYYSDGSMVRLAPVCRYTKEQACSREGLDGPRTHQHCWYDEGGIEATEEEHLKFGHVIVRQETPEQTAARIANETGETQHHTQGET